MRPGCLSRFTAQAAEPLLPGRVTGRAAAAGRRSARALAPRPRGFRLAARCGGGARLLQSRFVLRAQEPARRDRGLPRGVRRPSGPAARAQGRQPRRFRGRVRAARADGAGGREHPAGNPHAAGGRQPRAHGGGGHRALASSQRGVRPCSGRGDAARPARDRDRLVRQHGLHDAGGFGAGRLSARAGGRPARGVRGAGRGLGRAGSRARRPRRCGGSRTTGRAGGVGGGGARRPTRRLGVGPLREGLAALGLL